MRKRLTLWRVEFWWWMEHRRPSASVFGKSPYNRRKMAESDCVHRFRENIYGSPMYCAACGDKRYHKGLISKRDIIAMRKELEPDLGVDV